MPWRVETPMSQRLEFVEAFARGHWSIPSKRPRAPASALEVVWRSWALIRAHGRCSAVCTAGRSAGVMEVLPHRPIPSPTESPATAGAPSSPSIWEGAVAAAVRNQL